MHLEDFFVNTYCLMTHVKIFHFQTPSYASHKSADVFRDKVNVMADKILEVEQGVLGRRLMFKNKVSGKFQDVNTVEILEDMIRKYINFLETNMSKFDKSNKATIEELINDCNQFLYLLTFD